MLDRDGKEESCPQLPIYIPSTTPQQNTNYYLLLQLRLTNHYTDTFLASPPLQRTLLPFPAHCIER